jgi:hypothetical protein
MGADGCAKLVVVFEMWQQRGKPCPYERHCGGGLWREKRRGIMAAGRPQVKTQKLVKASLKATIVTRTFN